MRPILSIFSALIITILLWIILAIIYLNLSLNMSLDGFPFFTVLVLCGGIATWFSTENKIRYSVYYGVIIAVMHGFLLMNFLLILIPIFAGMGGFIAKNEKNTIKNLLNNEIQVKYKSFFINLYKRNKMVLTAPLVIFFASVLIGGIGPFLSGSFNHFMANLMANYLSGLSTGKLTTLSIFLNNSKFVVLYAYIGGISFGIISTIYLALNGVVFGFIVFNFPSSIIYILPHGIFEFLSYIIAVAAGFKLLSTALNILWDGTHIKRNNPLGEQVNEILNVNYLKFRDSMVLIVIAIVLLVIAAIIEANITVPFAKYLLNLINH